MEWAFFDFLDSNGANPIHVWLGDIPKKAKAKLNVGILHLRATPPGEWKRPFVDTLDDECTGLVEFRCTHRHVQYRLLGFTHRGREVTLVLGAREKNNAFVPANACQIALDRKRIVQEDIERRCAHDYR